MKLRNIDRKARVQNVMLFYTGIVFYILMALENHYKYFNFNWLEIAFVIHSFIFTFVNIYSFYYELPAERKDSIYKIREYVDENDYKKFNLVEVKTTLELGEIEFGIYTNSNKSTELKDLIKMKKQIS